MMNNQDSSKFIFVDRDGVINVDLGGYVTKPEDFRFEDGAVEALRNLQNAGFDIIVISNQAGVGDGIFSQEELLRVHHHMVNELAKKGVRLYDTRYCLHGKNEGCNCRKPETGLFEEVDRVLKLNREETWFIGDKATDIEAGKRFDLKTALVRTGYGKKDEEKLSGDARPDLVFDNLLKASEHLSQL